MGCLNSKPKEEDMALQRASIMHTNSGNTSNNPPSSSSRQVGKTSVGAKAGAPTRVLYPFKFSLVKSPPPDMLLRRMWIKKRGAIVRSWKERYFVLENKQLKYYTDEDTEPPYGKGLKGQLHLTGSVVEYHRTSSSTVQIEISGAHGEKELLLELDLTEAAQDWIRALTWSIRKCTLTVVMSIFDSKVLARRQSQTEETQAHKLSDLQKTMDDWAEHSHEEFDSAIEVLRSNFVLHYVKFKKNGKKTVAPCLIKLWKSFPAALPDETTDPYLFGLVWQPLPSDKIDPSVPVREESEQARSISFGDIADIIVSNYHDDDEDDEQQKAGVSSSSSFAKRTDFACSTLTVPQCYFCIDAARLAEGREERRVAAEIRATASVAGSRRRGSQAAAMGAGGAVANRRGSTKNPTRRGSQNSSSDFVNKRMSTSNLLLALAKPSQYPHTCDGRKNVSVSIVCKSGYTLCLLLCCLDGILVSPQNSVTIAGGDISGSSSKKSEFENHTAGGSLFIDSLQAILLFIDMHNRMKHIKKSRSSVVTSDGGNNKRMSLNGNNKRNSVGGAGGGGAKRTSISIANLGIPVVQAVEALQHDA